MNPLGVVLLIVSLTLIVSAFRGKQDNLIAAVLGKQYGKSDLK